MSLVRRIDALEGFEVPRGWAPAYRDPNRDVIVIAPLGLHMLVRYGRRLAIWLTWAGWKEQEAQFLAGFQAGYTARSRSHT